MSSIINATRHPLFWKSVTGVLLLIVLFQQFSSSSPASFGPHNSHARDWAYDWERDRNNHGLTNAQCDAAFPDLYFEIDRAVRYWSKERSTTISADNIDIDWRWDAALRILIQDGQIRIVQDRRAIEEKPYWIRVHCLLHQLQQAVLSAEAVGEPIPNVEFSVCMDDKTLIPYDINDQHTIWTWTRQIGEVPQDRLWLMPDYNFWAAPPFVGAFQDLQREARAHDSPLKEKDPRVVWRGVEWTNEEIRGALLEASKGKSWSDVNAIDRDSRAGEIASPEQCHYFFVVHTEGRSWSGRLTSLLNCDSVPIIHELEWTTSYYHLLVPDGPHQNFIPVKRDFSDLNTKVTYYLKNPNEAQRIANNSVAMFREHYTTPAAEACYWRRMLRSWRDVSFEPELYETANIAESGLEKMRGIPFEEYMLREYARL